jgi:subtilisin
VSRLGLVVAVATVTLFACAGVVWAQAPADDSAAQGEEEFVEDASGLEAGDPIPGKYIVVLEDDTEGPSSVANDLSAELDVETTNVYESALEGFAAEVPAGELAELRADPRVESVVRDRVIEASRQTRSIDRSQRSTVKIVQENGSSKASKAARKKKAKKKARKKKSRQMTPTGIRRIMATQSSTKAGNGKGRVNADIAILDSGIHKQHRDLNVAGGVNCVGAKRSAWSDGYGHGTHVAGTAAARDNRVGVVGVAPGARLWAVRVLNDSGEGTLGSAICGIDWVTKRAGTVEVANMSFTGTGKGSYDDGDCGNVANDPLHRAICASVSAGIFYTAAAGNTPVSRGEDFATWTPAAYGEVLTVTAMVDYNGKPGGGARRTCGSQRDDRVKSDSNFAAIGGPDEAHTIAAPGECIRSTWKNGKYMTDSGTSMAAPHVAGAAALCMTRGTCKGSPQDVMQKLRSDAAARPPTYGYRGDPNAPLDGRYYGYLVYAGGY